MKLKLKFLAVIALALYKYVLLKVHDFVHCLLNSGWHWTKRSKRWRGWTGQWPVQLP